MGIYDREYYRKEGHSVLGSFTERGHICKWLIAINVVAFVIQMMTVQYETIQDPEMGRYAARVPVGSPFTEALQLNLEPVLHGQIWRLLTYAFLHDTGSIWHIFWNMLLLWWFGSDVEDLYGPREFLAFYLISAVVGGLAFILTQWAGVTALIPCIGASGAVTAVLVLCALHYPTRMILVMFFLPVPIWAFVLVSVGWDLLKFLKHEEGGVAVTVHLGGAAFAYAYYQAQWRLLNLWPRLRGWQRQRTRPRLRVYSEEAPQPVPVAAPPTPMSDADEHLEAKMDAVLDKVKRSGLNSLTEGERQILVRASEVFKRRRT